MKKYAVGLIFLSVMALIACVGISTAFEPLDTLMKPPRVEGENLSIQLAFEENLGGNYLLKQPISGEHRSAYTFIDLTGDDEDEVIVFYSISDELGIVRMNVLDKIDGIWKSVADFRSVYNDIQEVAFADLNKDGSKEIIVGWITMPDSYSKLMSVYEIVTDDEMRIESVYSDYYSMFRVADIDRDGSDDVLALKQTPSANTAERTVFLIKYENGILVEKGDFVLDKSFSSLAGINLDFGIDNTQTTVYIDGYNVDGSLATDCLQWSSDSDSFTRCFVGDMSVSALSSRLSNVLCKDINSDGIIDIPTEEYLTYYDKLDDTQNSGEHSLNLINWINIHNEDTRIIGRYLNFPQYGFSFSFDEAWRDRICVDSNSQNDTVTFYSLAEYNGKLVKDKKLFSIMSKTDLDLDSIRDLYIHYTEVSYIKGRFYFCRIYEKAEEFGVTKKDIKGRIIAR